MNLIQYNKPIYALELVLLLTKSLKIKDDPLSNLSEDFVHSKEKDFRIEKIAPGYLSDYKILLDKSSRIIEKYPKILDIHKQHTFGVFTEIMYQLEDFNFKNLNLNNFTKASITALVSNFLKADIDEIEYLNKTIKDIYSKDTIHFSKLFSFVNKQDIKESYKFKILEFFNDIKFFYNNIMDLFNELAPIYDNFYNKHSRFVEALYKKSSKYKLSDLPIDQWIDLASFDKKLVDDIYFSYSLINYDGASIKIAPIEKQKSFILYGVFLDLFKQIEKEDSISVDSIEDQMNALGDSKRLKIFSLLLDKEYYLKELADSLDLTSSTVSHHMDILSSAGLLKLRSKGKRIYYSINPEQTKLISDFFKKVTNKLGEKDYDNKRTTAKK